MATTDPANLPGAPVNPSEAQGAQIPLQSFTLPDFPPAARGLKALTLTCDIKVDEYQNVLSQPYAIPDSIPYAIESLTLELFSLGYPPGFLARYFEKLRYRFGPRERAGLLTFFELAADVGALEKVPELRFLVSEAVEA